MLLLFSLSLVSKSLWPHGLQHTTLPCPSLSPRVFSNSCLLQCTTPLLTIIQGQVALTLVNSMVSGVIMNVFFPFLFHCQELSHASGKRNWKHTWATMEKGKWRRIAFVSGISVSFMVHDTIMRTKKRQWRELRRKMAWFYLPHRKNTVFE